MNHYPKPTCPPVTNIVHIEFQSKDGLVGYQDNYMLPPGMHRIVRSLAPQIVPYTNHEASYGQMIQQALNQSTYQTRTYEDTGKSCPSCGRRIFKEI